MKKTLFALVALLGLSAPAMAIISPTYVSVSTFTPGAALSKVYGFANHSSQVDVRILRIEVSHASTGTYTGGLMQYWVYTSTTITDGSVVQTSSYSLTAANSAVPASVIGSISPTTVVYENKQSSQLPIIPPLIVNNDETAAANFQAVYNAEGGDAELLKLPKGANRGFVLEQRRLGTADIADGTVMVRVVYTAK